MDDDEKDIGEIADDVNEMAVEYRQGPGTVAMYLISPLKKGFIYLMTVLPLLSTSYVVYAHRYTGWTYPINYDPYLSIALILIGIILTFVLYRFFTQDEAHAYIPGPGEDLDL